MKHAHAEVDSCLFDMIKQVDKDEANTEESKQESEGANASTSKFSDASQYTDLNPIGIGQFKTKCQVIFDYAIIPFQIKT